MHPKHSAYMERPQGLLRSQKVWGCHLISPGVASWDGSHRTLALTNGLPAGQRLRLSSLQPWHPHMAPATREIRASWMKPASGPQGKGTKLGLWKPLGAPGAPTLPTQRKHTARSQGAEAAAGTEPSKPAHPTPSRGPGPDTGARAWVQPPTPTPWAHPGTHGSRRPRRLGWAHPLRARASALPASQGHRVLCALAEGTDGN